MLAAIDGAGGVALAVAAGPAALACLPAIIGIAICCAVIALTIYEMGKEGSN